MFTQIRSAGIRGMEGFLVSVEADVSNGLPGFSISGQLALEVREAQERVRTALKNSDFQLPAKKITVNLSPAGRRKEGTVFDLPIAAAVLGAFELLSAEKLKDALLIGELGLDGSVKPVRGVLVLVSAAKKMGFRRCLLPVANVSEGTLVEGIQIIGIQSLRHLQEVLSQDNWEDMDLEISGNINRRTFKPEYLFDFKEICGQSVLRRTWAFDVRKRRNRKIHGGKAYSYDPASSFLGRKYRNIKDLQSLRITSQGTAIAFPKTFPQSTSYDFTPGPYRRRKSA